MARKREKREDFFGFSNSSSRTEQQNLEAASESASVLPALINQLAGIDKRLVSVEDEVSTLKKDVDAASRQTQPQPEEDVGAFLRRLDVIEISLAEFKAKYDKLDKFYGKAPFRRVTSVRGKGHLKPSQEEK